MSPHGITGPLEQSSRNSGNKFRLARSLTRPNFVALRQKVCELSLVEKFCSPEKYAKVHQSIGIRQYTSFCRHSAVTLALECFVSEISLVLYRKCHFYTYCPHLSPKIWTCCPTVRSMSSVAEEGKQAATFFLR